MNKEEFLTNLRKKLSILKKEEINDIINEYSEFIDEKLKKKEKEEKIIKDLGEIDDLVDEILDAYKIDNNYNKNAGTKFFEECNKIIETLVNKFSGKSFKEVIRFIMEILVILIFIWILKIPFSIVESLGTNIFELSYAPVTEAIQTIWKVFVELSYLVVAVLIFINIFKVRYLKEEDSNENIRKEEVKTINKDAKKPEIKPKKEVVTNNSSNSIIFSFFKLIVIFMAIPFIFSLIGLACGLGGIIYVGIISNWFIGLLLICVALLLGNIWLLKIFYKIIFDKEMQGIRLLIELIVIIVMFVVGIGITSYEFSQIKMVTPEAKKVLSVNETIPLNTFYRTEIEDTYYTSDDAEVIYDNSLNNEAKIKIEYLENTSKPILKQITNGKYEVTNNNFSRIYIKEFFNNLKNNEILNYDNADAYKVTIYVNKKDMMKLDLDDGYYLDGIYYEIND